MTRKSLCAMRRKTPQGKKCIFRAQRARFENFPNNSHYSNFGRASDECMAMSMFTPTAKRQKLAFIFSIRKILVLRSSASLDHMVDVTADANHMPYFVLAT